MRMSPALEWVPARRSLMFTFGGYCFREAWFEGLELLTHITQIKTSLDETAAAIVPLLQRHAAIFVPSHPVDTRVPPAETDPPVRSIYVGDRKPLLHRV